MSAPCTSVRLAKEDFVSVWFHFGPLSGAGLVTVLNDCDFVGSKVQFEFSNPRMRGFPRICAMDSHGEEIGLRRDLTSEIFVSPSNDSVVIGSPAAGAQMVVHSLVRVHCDRTNSGRAPSFITRGGLCRATRVLRIGIEVVNDGEFVDCS
jgi:hypothetical protein